MTLDDWIGLTVSAIGGGCLGYFIDGMWRAWKDRPYHSVRRDTGGWGYIRRR